MKTLSRMKYLFSLALVLFMALPWKADAQQQVVPCVSNFSSVTGATGCKNITDSYGLPVNIISGGSGGGPVYGPTAAGSAAANPPVLMGGTIDGTSTGNVDNWKVSGGVGYITGNLTQGGSALGVTNGLYSNLLQGNAVLSLTNPIFVTPATSASWAVTGTFYQATQPVSGPTANGSPAANPPVLMGGTANGTATGNVENWKVDSSGLGYISVTGWAGGTLGAMANYGTSPGAVLVPGVNASVCDTSNCATVKPASTAPVATDKSVVVGLNPNSPGIIPTASGQNQSFPAGWATFGCEYTTSPTTITTGNGSPIACDNANRILTNDLLQASQNHIGEVGSNIIAIPVGLVTSNNTVTTGKSIGGTITLAGAALVSGTSGAAGTGGIIQNLSIFFKDAVAGTAADVYFFNASPSSTCTDNTAFALSASDLAAVIGIAHVTDFTASNTGVIAQANNLAMSYSLSSSTTLYACLVTRASFVITSTANAEIIVNVLR